MDSKVATNFLKTEIYIFFDQFYIYSCILFFKQRKEKVISCICEIHSCV